MKFWLPLVLLLFMPSSPQALNTKEQQWVDAVALTYGTRAGKRVETWRKEIAKHQNAPERDKLTEINRFFNQLYFVNDIDLWGKMTTGRHHLSF